MKRLILAVFLVFCCLPGQAQESDFFLTLLPVAGEMPGWKPGATPQHYEGDDLYLLINGGAEICQEYGFKQVVAQTYKSNGGKTINLEIYEMTDGAAAYGMFTFKTSGEGNELTIGQGAILEDYYLNYWQGPYLVTLIGFDEEKETLDGIKTMAILIENKIKDQGERPHLLNLLPGKNLQAGYPKYFKGNLSLFNHCNFIPPDLLQVREGILGHYGTHRVLILARETESLARQDSLHAALYFKEKNSTDLSLAYSGRYVVFVKGEPPDGAEALLERMIASWDSP